MLVKLIDRLKHRKTVLVIRIINFLYLSVKKMFLKFVRLIKKMVRYTVSDQLYNILSRSFTHLRLEIGQEYPKARWYLREGYTVERFFDCINQENARYVVLRWFEELPNVKFGEDIDVLVADEDLDLLRSFCVPYDNGNQKFDFYAVSGISGTLYEGAPYFPLAIANKIICEGRIFKGKYKVPSPECYIDSMIYHVIMHKGEHSGLPYSNEDMDSNQNPDHDYKSIIRNKIVSSDITFLNLYAYLKSSEWLPSLDTQRLLARNNLWLNRVLMMNIKPAEKIKGSLLVFVIREWALQEKRLDYILKEIAASNLEILMVHKLEGAEKIRANDYIRGGNWGKGPYPKSGGGADTIIACFDYSPKYPSDELKKVYPFLDNENILIKHRIRDNINRDLLFFSRVNCLHSADDENEAFDYIRIVDMSLYNEVCNKVSMIRSSGYFHECEVKETFVANGTRAKTELIRNQAGEVYVLKTYKPGRERFYEREAFVYSELSQLNKLIPKPISIENNRIALHYYHDILKDKLPFERKKIVKNHTLKILELMKLFYDHGYAILGFYPGNLIVTPDDDLKVIDFEFLYKYKNKPISFRYSYDLVGVPSDFDGDLPRGSVNHNYKNTWKEYFDYQVYQDYMKKF